MSDEEISLCICNLSLCVRNRTIYIFIFTSARTPLRVCTHTFIRTYYVATCYHNKYYTNALLSEYFFNITIHNLTMMYFWSNSVSLGVITLDYTCNREYCRRGREATRKLKKMGSNVCVCFHLRTSEISNYSYWVILPLMTNKHWVIIHKLGWIYFSDTLSTLTNTHIFQWVTRLRPGCLASARVRTTACSCL